jgi:hypothetical protein
MSPPAAVKFHPNELQLLSRRRGILAVSILGFALGLTAAWTGLLAYGLVSLIQFAI